METTNIETTENPEKSFNRANVSRELYKVFAEAEAELQNRDVKVSFQAFSEFLATKINQKSVVNEFIELHTPFEFRVKELLKNPDKKKELERLVKKL